MNDYQKYNMKPARWAWLVLLLNILTSGCASQRGGQPASTIFSDTLSPTLFPRLLKLEDQGRLIIDKVLLQSVAEQYNNPSQQILQNHLSQTTDKRLLANRAFTQAQQSLSVSNTISQNGYALALSHYLTDRTYACHSPLYAQYFAARYQRQLSYENCANKLPINVITESGERILWLNPERISQVHLLFAGEDDNLMSQFGHISLRLVVCPENDFSQDACDQNLYEHLVLGFRAHVDDITISTMKGLLGDYRAYLYANNFMDIYKEYTIEEFRDIYSLPLKLSPQQREDMLRGLAEIHWRFAGDYKFLTKNCSTLLQSALIALWPDYATNTELQGFWRPDSFFSEMRDSELTEYQQLEDLKLAEENGFFFASNEPIYKKALAVVSEAMQRPSFNNLEDYMHISPIVRYKMLEQDRQFYQQLKQDRYLHGAQLLLEQLSVVQYLARMKSGMAHFFNRHSIGDVNQHMKSTLNNTDYAVFASCILKPMMAYLQPQKRSNGIPTKKSLANPAIATLSCESNETQMILGTIRDELQTIDPESWRPIKLFMLSRIAAQYNIEKLLAIEPSKGKRS